MKVTNPKKIDVTCIEVCEEKFAQFRGKFRSNFVAKMQNLSIDGLSDEQIEKAKSLLMERANIQYQKLTKSVILMEKFKPEIVALRKSGHPWNAIAAQIESATRQKISATTLRNYFNRAADGAAKKSRQESISDAPNPFQPIALNLKPPPGIARAQADHDQAPREPGLETPVLTS